LFISSYIPSLHASAAPSQLSAMRLFLIRRLLPAAQLVAGDRIEDIADARGVSRETVRVQVKNLLAKTEARGLGQLIGLASRSLAALRRLSKGLARNDTETRMG
jgi:DNA-binding NarL/FixJ family response regulator